MRITYSEFVLVTVFPVGILKKEKNLPWYTLKSQSSSKHTL
jgi:hypothetical protein